MRWPPELAFTALFLLSRLLMLAALTGFTGGREFTDDLAMHIGMVRSPLAPLLGQTDASSHPPLMGLMLAVVARPLLPFLSEFLAMRLASIAWETAAAFLFAMIARRRFGMSPLRSAPTLAFLVMPMGWMTSVVMAQDEVVALLFVLATVWLLAGGKPISALIACSFGVASGKIFLAVPLAALIVLLPGRPLWKKAVAGAGPAAFFYAWAFVASAVGGTRIPLLDFNPGVACSISVWVFLVQVGGLTFETARRLSGASVALALAGVVIAARRRHVVPTASSPVLLVAVTLLWTFSLFFHVNPEYYVLVLPVLLLVFPTWRAALGLIAASMLPWGVNFLYGVRNAAGDPSGGGGKEAFVRLYRSVLSADPGLLYNVALAMSVGVMLGLAIVVTAAMLRGSPAPTQAPAD